MVYSIFRRTQRGPAHLMVLDLWVAVPGSDLASRGNLWSAWFNGSSHALNVQGDTLAVLKVWMKLSRDPRDPGAG